MRNSIGRIRLTFFFILVSLALCGAAAAQNSGAMPAGQAPGAPAGSYPLSDLETINYFNGHLNFRLPLVTIGGRGGARFTVPFVAGQTWVMESYFNQATQSNVYYESDSWRNGPDPGFSPGVVQGYAARFYDPDVCNLPPNKGLLTHPQTLSYLTFTSPDGTQYSLYSPHGRAHFDPCAQSGFSRGRVFTTADGSAATFISDTDIIDYPFPNHATEFSVSGYLLLRDGTRYRVVDGQVTEVRDRNGNRLTVGYDVNGRAHTITDPLGRVVTINYNVQEGGQYGTNTQIVFSGFGGAQRVVRLSQTNLGGALRPGYSLQPHGADTTLYDPPVTSSFWLPDGRRYRLLYNDMGELARMELPTGGAIEYDHEGGLEGGDPEGTFEGLPDGANGHYVHIHRRLVERRIYSNGGTGSAWTARTTVSKPDGLTAAQTTGYVEVKQYGKQPNGSAVLLTCERHIFNGSAKPTIEQSPFTDPPSGAEIDGREARTEIYDTSGGTVGALLRKVEYTWLSGDSQVEGAHVSEIKTTLADTGQVTRQTFSYDRYGNQTDVWEYGFGTAQYAVRHTRTDYETAANYVNADLNPLTGASLRSLTRSQRSYSVNPSTGAETIASKTEVRYDEPAYPLLPCDPNGVVQCGSVPQWADPGTAARGNATSVRSFIDAAASADPAQACPAGVCVETHARYDQLGNLRYSADARGKVSEMLYGDSFCNGTTCGAAPYTPNTFAFVVLTKTPKPDQSGTYGSAAELTSSTVYDFYTGLTYSTTDANNRTTLFAYEDQPNQLDRLKRVDKPDGGRTTYNYYDQHQCGALVEAHTLLDSTGRETSSWQFFDGLGRPYLSESTDGQDVSNPYLRVDTRYDALSRVSQVSNPYRTPGCTAAPNPSGRWTTNAYDALGRVKTVTTPDGAVVTTSYLGNTITVTDQAGRKRSSVSDALGRLTQVIEDPTAGGLNYITTYTYDVLGNLRKVDQGGQVRFFMYDSLSRLTRAKNPEQAAGSAVSNVTDTVTGNSQWSLAYGYDDNGNPTARVDARGVTINYAYDNLNRNTVITYTTPVGIGVASMPDVKRYYDNAAAGANGLGRLYSSEVVGVSSSFFDSYDAVGRPLSYHQIFGVNGTWGQPFYVTRAYDKAGNVTSQTYPSGRTVSYAYDAAGRLSSFAGNLGDGVARTYSNGISYGEFGGIQQEQFGTATPLYNKRHYNVRGQLFDTRLSSVAWATDQWNWNRGALLNYFSAAELSAASNATRALSGTDNNGNLRRAGTYIPLSDSGVYTEGNTASYAYYQDDYDYDVLNRLSYVAETAGGTGVATTTPFKQSYAYDRWGNRTIKQSETFGVAATQFELQPQANQEVAEPSNRLYAPGDSARAPSQKLMRYDAAGNLVYDAHTGQGARVYDAENRMTQAQDVYQQWSTYTYDADGRRVKKLVANQETWQIYGVGGELLAEYRSGSAPMTSTKEYGYRGKELLVTMSSGDDQRLKRFVTNLYYGALRRDPTPQELADTSNQLAAAGAQGKPQLLGKAKQVARALFTQTAYDTSPARTDSQYVSDLYYAYLQRAADDSGVSWWVSQLSSKGRSGVCDDFQNSIEFDVLVTTLYGNAQSDNQRTEQFVNNFYLGAYGRFATPAELQQQRDALNVAAAQDQAHVQTQAEAMGRALFAAQAADLSLPAQQFVTNLYEGFLQRGPDATGLSFWTAQAGTTVTARQAVLSSFATSPAAKELAGALYREAFWLVTDNLGTPRMVVDKSGSLAGVKRHDHLPFGEELPGDTGGRATTQGYSQNDGVRQKFTGYERDQETNLDYAQSRYYANGLGRFASIDPIMMAPDRMANPQQINLYCYVQNNPLKFVDPTGEKAKVTVTVNNDERTATVTIEATFAVYAAAGQGVTERELNEQKDLIKKQIEETYAKSFNEDGLVTYTVEAKITVTVVKNEQAAIEGGRKGTFDNIVEVGSKYIWNREEKGWDAGVTFHVKGEKFDRMKVSLPTDPGGTNLYPHEFSHGLGSDMHLAPGNVGSNDKVTPGKITSEDFRTLFGVQAYSAYGMQKSKVSEIRHAPTKPLKYVSWRD